MIATDVDYLTPTTCRFCGKPVVEVGSTWECIDFQNCGFAWTWKSWGKELGRRILVLQARVEELETEIDNRVDRSTYSSED